LLCSFLPSIASSSLLSSSLNSCPLLNFSINSLLVLSCILQFLKSISFLTCVLFSTRFTLYLVNSLNSSISPIGMYDPFTIPNEYAIANLSASSLSVFFPSISLDCIGFITATLYPFQLVFRKGSRSILQLLPLLFKFTQSYSIPSLLYGNSFTSNTFSLVYNIPLVTLVTTSNSVFYPTC